MHHEVTHPCIQHKLALIRDTRTGHKEFRELATEITMLVCYEALKEIRVRDVDVETPLTTARCRVIDEDIVVVPILRAGVGMLDGILALVPSARVGFVGLERNEETALPSTYYNKMPYQIRGGISIIVDPMLATGGSTNAAIDMLKAQGAERIAVVCIVTCPDGLRAVEEAHPDVSVYAASVDPELNENKYIVPGLGDAGDRLYGTI
jgi:uracil phosphoribosyltransferase